MNIIKTYNKDNISQFEMDYSSIKEKYYNYNKQKRPETNVSSLLISSRILN